MRSGAILVSRFSVEPARKRAHRRILGESARTAQLRGDRPRSPASLRSVPLELESAVLPSSALPRDASREDPGASMARVQRCSACSGRRAPCAKCLRRYDSSVKTRRIKAIEDRLESLDRERAQLLVELDRERYGFARTDISSGPPPTVDEILERYR